MSIINKTIDGFKEKRQLAAKPVPQPEVSQQSNTEQNPQATEQDAAPIGAEQTVLPTEQNVAPQVSVAQQEVLTQPAGQATPVGVPQVSAKSVEQTTPEPAVDQGESPQIEGMSLPERMETSNIARTQPMATSKGVLPAESKRRAYLDDKDYEYLEGLGYTRDQVDYWLSDNDEYGPLARAVESTFTKPAELDEKKIKRAKTFAGIVDGLGGLAQILALSKGAHLKERDKFASDNVLGKEKELRDAYDKQLANYQGKVWNAKLGDLAEKGKGRDKMAALIGDKRAQESAAQQAEAKRLWDQIQFAAKMDIENKKLALDELKIAVDDAYKKGQISIGHRNAATGEINALARTISAEAAMINALKPGSGGNTYNFGGRNKVDENGNLVIQLSVPQGTQGAYSNELGRFVKDFALRPEDVDHLAQSAISDKEFLDKNPHLYISQYDPIEGKGKNEFQDKNTMAWQYANYLYGKGDLNKVLSVGSGLGGNLADPSSSAYYAGEHVFNRDESWDFVNELED